MKGSFVTLVMLIDPFNPALRPVSAPHFRLRLAVHSAAMLNDPLGQNRIVHDKPHGQVGCMSRFCLSSGGKRRCQSGSWFKAGISLLEPPGWVLLQKHDGALQPPEEAFQDAWLVSGL